MKRRSLALALLGLVCGLTAAENAFGGHRGQTYHFNGASGYWTAPVYATPAATYVTPASYYTPPQTYYAPQPTYVVAQPAPYAQPQPVWRLVSAPR